MTISRFLRLSALTGAFASLAVATPARAQSPNPTTITFSDYRSTTTVEPGYQATFGDPLTANGYEFYDLYTQSSSAGPNNISSQQMSTWGTSPSDLGSRNLPSNLGPNAAALWGNGTTDRLEMYASSGGPFKLYSMDMASLFARSSIYIPGSVGPPATMNIYFQYFKSLEAYTTGVPDGDLYAHVTAAPTVNDEAIPLLRTVDFTGNSNTSDVFVQFLDGNAGDLTDARGIYGIQWFQGSLTNAQGDFTYANIDNWALTQRSGLSHQFTNVVAAAVVPEPGTFTLASVGLLTVVGVCLRRKQQIGVKGF